jgi:GAF domain-containing protein
MLAVPVLVGDRMIGALFARADAPHHFSSEDMQALSLLAAQVGPTIETARLFVEAQRRRAEAEALAEIMAVGATDRDSNRVIALICERACQLISADYGGIALTEADGSLSWRGMWGNRTDMWQRPGNFRGRGPFTESTTTGTTVVWQLGDPPADRADRMVTHYAEGGRTLLSAPLPVNPDFPGALLLGWRTQVTPTAGQIQFAETLANYAALIVENMQR